MKKLKKFISGKGGIIAIITTFALILLALFLMVIGLIYSDYDGDWSKIPAVLGSNYAITIYVVAGLVIVAFLYIYILCKRKEDI